MENATSFDKSGSDSHSLRWAALCAFSAMKSLPCVKMNLVVTDDIRLDQAGLT
jgi:hypothetical protein